MGGARGTRKPAYARWGRRRGRCAVSFVRRTRGEGQGPVYRVWSGTDRYIAFGNAGIDSFEHSCGDLPVAVAELPDTRPIQLRGGTRGFARRPRLQRGQSSVREP